MGDRAETRHAAKRDAPDVVIPPPMIYLATFLVAAGLEIFFPTPQLPLLLAVGVGTVGSLVWLGLDPTSMWWFRKAGTTVVPNGPVTTLVQDGPYRLSRNPMYLGMLVLLTTAGLALGLLWTLPLLPAVVLAIDHLAIQREEAHLEKRFGDTYRAYRKRVRRWI